ncbi:hypothetical protein Rhe02_47150 [Rhizocola hellebori]|uniref:Uncharacterized protein n=1 Tax=Rhizocola hellebori TaxID=1392758 RepID=A0A8J3Q9I8_9ACTN|nr:hypothetical protein [Rhizocola hellebori]GIH06648.1 hypothetical protein Rhe02_47150 [Rhizocola hellebori]
MRDYEEELRQRNERDTKARNWSQSAHLEHRAPSGMVSPPPLDPMSWGVEQYEGNAAYRMDARMRYSAVIAQHAVDAVVDVHDYINQRSRDRHPALQAQLRRIEAAVGDCSALLIARYMGGR